jgi:malate dehydrogenase
VRTVAILGGGDLAATLARRLAEAQAARRVVLVDEDVGRARGKALDILQSGPVEGFDVAVEGAADFGAAGPIDVLVVADAPELPEGTLRPSATLVGKLRQAPARTLLVASAHACALVEDLVAAGLPRDRVLGSGALAQAAALRRHLAEQLEVEPRELTATVLGVPPHALIAPQSAALLGGAPIASRQPSALRQALAAVSRRAPGPVALAAAAARVIGALAGLRPTVLPVVTVLDGEYGQRGVALAAPARLRAGRVDGVLDVPLEPVERIAIENAAQRRFARRD